MGALAYAIATAVFPMIGTRIRDLPFAPHDETHPPQPSGSQLEEAELGQKDCFGRDCAMQMSFEVELVGKSDLLSTTILEESSSGEF